MKMGTNLTLEGAVRRAFHAALLLTGSRRGAEHAVESALERLPPDFTAERLVEGAVRDALQLPKCADEMLPGLPDGLRVLFLLSPKGRSCLVLRTLLGIDRDACSEILKLSRDEVDETLHQAMLDLNPAVQLSDAGVCDS